MNILEFKRKALGHTFRYEVGDPSTGAGENTSDYGSNNGGSNTWSDVATVNGKTVGGTVTTGPTGASWGSQGGFSMNNAISGGKAGLSLGGIPGGIAGFFGGGLTGYTPGGSVNYDGTPTTSGGGMFSGGPGDSLSSIFSIASGINAMGNQSGGAQSLADPFSPYRSGLAASYNQALTQGNLTDITKMPGYSQYQSGVMDPTMEAVKRSMAVRGMNQSGNELLALQETGQKGYYGFMADYLNRLAQGSGAVNNPAQAAGMGIEQQNLNQRATMQGLGAIGQGLSGLSGYFTGGGSGGGYSAAGYDVGGSGALNTSAYGSGLPAWQLAQADIYG